MNTDRTSYFKEYRSRPEVKEKKMAYLKEYRSRPEVRERKKIYQREWRSIEENRINERARNRKKKRIRVRPLGESIERSKRYRERLPDPYIISLIRQDYENIIDKTDITKEMIETHKYKVKLKRLCQKLETSAS